MCTLFRLKLTFTTLMFNYQSIAFLKLKILSYFKNAILVKKPGISKIVTGTGTGIEINKKGRDLPGPGSRSVLS